MFLIFKARINKLSYFEVEDLDCNKPGSSKLVANTLEDLAGIIEDVGITNLCKQIGLNYSECSFKF